MGIMNSSKIYELENKNFFVIIILLQAVLWTLITLGSSTFLATLRQIIAFIYLTFIPGILILRILRINKLSTTETLLYIVGLSLSTLMFTGFLMNMLYPFFGISRPISPVKVIISISGLVLLLSVLSYLRNKKTFHLNFLDYGRYLSPPQLLILFLLPFLSIFGAYLMNFYDNNLLQMTTLLVIAVIPIFVIFNKIPKKLLPLVIFLISISLLYHTTLISQYIWGADINREYYLSSNVLKNAYWDFSFSDNYNAMLSVNFLVPIYSIFMKLSPVWVFKIVFPVLFSLVPIGLFFVYQSQTNEKISFLSCFLFMAFFAYFTVMPALARQQIAELFLTLLIILIVDEKLNKKTRSLLLVIFGASLIVSHYGTSYIFLFIMTAGILIVNTPISKHFQLSSEKFNYKILKPSYIVLFFIVAFAWYMYVSQASVLTAGVKIGGNILNSLSELFSPGASQPLAIYTSRLPFFQSVERYLNLFIQIFIGIGIISTLFNGNKQKFNSEFLAFSWSIFGISVLGILLPYFVSSLNSDRVFHLSLFFLAPYSIIGAMRFMDVINKRIIKERFKHNSKQIALIVSAFLLFYFLLNSAFLYQIFDQPKLGRFALDKDTDFMSFNNNEIAAAKWLENERFPSANIYADINRACLLRSRVDVANEMDIWEIDNKFKLSRNSYIFLGYFNIEKQQLLVRESWNEVKYISISRLDLEEYNKIYDNDRSSIFISKGE